MFDVNPGDATLAVYEGSHRYHEEFFKTFKTRDASGIMLWLPKVVWYCGIHEPFIKEWNLSRVERARIFDWSAMFV